MCYRVIAVFLLQKDMQIITADVRRMGRYPGKVRLLAEMLLDGELTEEKG